MKKHLALVISSLGAGGAERVLSELANTWVKEGYKISMITLASQDTRPFYTLAEQINLLQLNQLNSENANVFMRLKNIYKRVMTLRRTLKKLQPDLIISFIDIMNITTLLAATGLNIPVVVSERIDPAFHPIPKLYKQLRWIAYKWAAAIVVQTVAAKAYFSSALQSKIHIIPNIVHALPGKKSQNSKVLKIISMGRLVSQKDYPTLIKAFAPIAMHYPDMELIIYGEGKERAYLQSLIQSLSLSHRIHLPGIIEPAYEALRKADLFVFSSLYEGFPNALCEALSMGLPVIASNCSGNTEVVQDTINGRLFPIGDVVALTTLMKEIIEDSVQRKRLSKEAAKITMQFGESKVLKMWKHIIKNATALTS